MTARTQPLRTSASARNRERHLAGLVLALRRLACNRFPLGAHVVQAAHEKIRENASHLPPTASVRCADSAFRSSEQRGILVSLTHRCSVLKNHTRYLYRPLTTAKTMTPKTGCCHHGPLRYPPPRDGTLTSFLQSTKSNGVWRFVCRAG